MRKKTNKKIATVNIQHDETTKADYDDILQKIRRIDSNFSYTMEEDTSPLSPRLWSASDRDIDLELKKQ